mmetsp:Transcript_118861/g.341340  ORF Transcript_118861/g.341340 Transcript_118861/m.341340 type:complete len:242 (-) Transcript_118861:183-908(-)
MTRVGRLLALLPLFALLPSAPANRAPPAPAPAPAASFARAQASGLLGPLSPIAAQGAALLHQWERSWGGLLSALSGRPDVSADDEDKPIYDPRKIEAFVKRLEWLPVPEDVLSYAVEFIADPHEHSVKSQHAECFEWEAVYDDWDLKLTPTDNGTDTMLFEISAKEAGKVAVSDVVETTPHYDHRGFVGFRGRGKASFAKPAMAEAIYNIEVDGGRIHGTIRNPSSNCSIAFPFCSRIVCF